MTATVLRADRRAPHDPAPWGRRGWLLLACAVGAAVEAAALANALPDARSLAPQATAVGPLAVWHDLRWLLAATGSWPVLLAGAVALFVGRGALLAALWCLAAPEPRPWRRVWPGAATFTAVSALLLSPMVAVQYGLALVPFSWPYLAAVPGALILCGLLAPGPRPGWSRVLPAPCLVGAVGLDALASTAGSLLLLEIPASYAVPLAFLVGLGNGCCWLLAAAPARQTTRVPIVPLAALAFLGVTIAGAWAGFTLRAAPQPPQPVAAHSATGRPVLVVAGFGASCCRKASPLQAPGLDVVQFSYRGLDEQGTPIPHGRRATDRPVPVLAAALARQVELLHQRTGRPVTIVAESEGTLVADRFLAAHPAAPVDRAWLLSPILDPVRVARGRAGGWVLDLVVDGVRHISPFEVSAEGPLLGSVSSADRPPTAGRPLTVLVVPLADALTLPLRLPHLPVTVVDGFHGGLLGDPAVQQRLRGWLSGRAQAPPGRWPAIVTWVRDAAATWRVPPLR